MDTNVTIRMDRAKKAYSTPAVRDILLCQEFYFLASNLEPIDGGDNPDIDW